MSREKSREEHKSASGARLARLIRSTDLRVRTVPGIYKHSQIRDQWRLNADVRKFLRNNSGLNQPQNRRTSPRRSVTLPPPPLTSARLCDIRKKKWFNGWLVGWLGEGSGEIPLVAGGPAERLCLGG